MESIFTSVSSEDLSYLKQQVLGYRDGIKTS
jgi:hypothetical protein